MHAPTEAPVLTVPESPISSAARGLAAAKARLDELCRTGSGRLLARQTIRSDEGGHTISPYGFAGLVLPFFATNRHHTTGIRQYKALVPTAMVIGDSWDWYPDSLDESKKQDVVRIVFDRFDRSTDDRAVVDCAEYGFVRPLGLVLAHEGKNRVALFRELDLPYIPAVVHEEGYPAPERIRIHEVADEVFAVLDGRYVERYCAVELGRRLLATYGVEFDTEWPDGYPSLDRVRGAFRTKRLVDTIGTPTVDLVGLALDEAVEGTEVTVALADVAGIRWPKPKRLYMGAGLVLVLVATMPLAAPHPHLLNLLLFAFGVLVAVFVLPFLAIVGCRVQDLRDGARPHHNHEVRGRLMAGNPPAMPRARSVAR